MPVPGYPFRWNSMSSLNAFCPSNTWSKSKTRASVKWSSWQDYPADEFALVNLRQYCGQPLLKACPSCGSYLRSPHGQWCTKCGERIHDRPTNEDLAAIETSLGSGSELPF